MIRQITGTIAHKNLLSVVIDVGGIGYLIHTTGADIAVAEGTELTLHTHLAVRENALDLYGFVRREELEMFELLLSIPKVGPKSAMQIMSHADVALLKKAAHTDDPTYLTKMSGIGKKTAEKIVVELKSKLGADESGAYAETNAGDGDVVDALLTLGYSQKEARDTLASLPAELTDTNDRIKEAIKRLGK